MSMMTNPRTKPIKKHISSLSLCLCLSMCMALCLLLSVSFADPTPYGKSTKQSKPDLNAEPMPVSEPKPEPVAITPNGNLSLIDDFQASEPTDKDFITVKTKNDQVFYIIIDRQRDEDQVYFLSQVDERTLLEILKEPNLPPELQSPSDSPLKSPFESPLTTEPTESPQPTTSPSSGGDNTQATNQDTSPSPLLAGLLLLAFGLIPLGALVYFVLRKKKTKQSPNPYAEYLDPSYKDPTEEEEDL